MVPREVSLANSGINTGKAENQVIGYEFGRSETIRRSQTRRLEGSRSLNELCTEKVILSNRL